MIMSSLNVEMVKRILVFGFQGKVGAIGTYDEILQIDATVLAGLLILTTIIPLEISNSVQNIWTSQSSWAFWVGWGFSLSAIFSCGVFSSANDF